MKLMLKKVTPKRMWKVMIPAVKVAGGRSLTLRCHWSVSLGTFCLRLWWRNNSNWPSRRRLLDWSRCCCDNQSDRRRRRQHHHRRRRLLNRPSEAIQRQSPYGKFNHFNLQVSSLSCTAESAGTPKSFPHCLFFFYLILFTHARQENVFPFSPYQNGTFWPTLAVVVVTARSKFIRAEHAKGWRLMTSRQRRTAEK